MGAERVPIGAFLDSLRWLDGKPLHVEPYRRRLFHQFNERDTADRAIFNLLLSGRSKKNNKTLDAMLAAMYALFDESPQGSQVPVVANDEDQAGDDLDLLKKLFRANPRYLALVTIKQRRIERKDGRGYIEVLPAQDAAGAHGKTYRLLVCDEIHAWRNWDLLEALAPDPTRDDAQQWITSYASIYHRPGAPLHDLMQQAKGGLDPRFLFSWYGGDFTTDPEFADATPEVRANPSMGSWTNRGYLGQQQRRLPSHKYRRLHLNLPGLPEGSAFQPDPIANAITRGVSIRPPVRGIEYKAFVDMSGGSSDDATLSIAHLEPETGLIVVDLVMNQGAGHPFDPRAAVERFVPVVRSYRVGTVIGDAYAGETFRSDFRRLGLLYRVSSETKSELYEEFEPVLNGGRVRLPDVPQLEQQLLGLVWRGSKIDHQPGEHDDWANAACGAAYACDPDKRRQALALITVDDIESTRRCAALDAERIENGTMDAFLNAQCRTEHHDDYGFPGRAETRRLFAQMTPQQRRDYGMAGRGKRR